MLPDLWPAQLQISTRGNAPERDSAEEKTETIITGEEKKKTIRLTRSAAMMGRKKRLQSNDTDQLRLL
jgi:hypothetical protein